MANQNRQLFGVLTANSPFPWHINGPFTRTVTRDLWVGWGPPHRLCLIWNPASVHSSLCPLNLEIPEEGHSCSSWVEWQKFALQPAFSGRKHNVQWLSPPWPCGQQRGRMSFSTKHLAPIGAPLWERPGGQGRGSTHGTWMSYTGHQANSMQSIDSSTQYLLRAFRVPQTILVLITQHGQNNTDSCHQG